MTGWPMRGNGMETGTVPGTGTLTGKKQTIGHEGPVGTVVPDTFLEWAGS